MVKDNEIESYDKVAPVALTDAVLSAIAKLYAGPEWSIMGVYRTWYGQDEGRKIEILHCPTREVYKICIGNQNFPG